MRPMDDVNRATPSPVTETCPWFQKGKPHAFKSQTAKGPEFDPVPKNKQKEPKVRPWNSIKRKSASDGSWETCKRNLDKGLSLFISAVLLVSFSNMYDKINSYRLNMAASEGTDLWSQHSRGWGRRMASQSWARETRFSKALSQNRKENNGLKTQLHANTLGPVPSITKKRLKCYELPSISNKSCAVRYHNCDGAPGAQLWPQLQEAEAGAANQAQPETPTQAQGQSKTLKALAAVSC